MSFFNHLYSTNNRQSYSPDDKPKTRLQLLKQILKDHFFNLIPFNLILLVVFFPMIFWVVTGLQYMLTVMGTDGTFADFISLSRTWVTVMIPCLTITGPFLAGIAIVMRNLARDDFHFPKRYFLSGMKASWKPALLISAVSSLIPLFIWAAFAFYGPMIQDSSHFASIPLLLVIILCLIWLMILPTLYMMIGTYQQKLSAQIKNAFALTLSHLPLVTGVHLLTCLPLFVGILSFLIGGQIFNYALIILCLYYLMFGFSFEQLLYAFVANKLCEETLNVILGEDTHIGMD